MQNTLNAFFIRVIVQIALFHLHEHTYSNPMWQFRIRDNRWVAAYLLSSKSPISAIRLVSVANSNRKCNHTCSQSFRWSLSQSSNTVVESRYQLVSPSSISQWHCSCDIARSNRNRKMCWKIQFTIFWLNFMEIFKFWNFFKSKRNQINTILNAKSISHATWATKSSLSTSFPVSE